MRKPSLTRKELARAIHEQLGFSLRVAGELVDDVFLCLRETLLAGESVKLVQFGTFLIRDKAARLGRNPRTGVPMAITPRRVVSFRPSKKLRQRINGQGGG
ncbi:MAG: integration host factor subunit alpha [Thermodesulfobacteriota bacterium]